MLKKVLLVNMFSITVLIAMAFGDAMAETWSIGWNGVILPLTLDPHAP